MTAKELQAFHRLHFCACGRKSTRKVKGVGFCNSHSEQARAAAAAESIEVESAAGVKAFVFDHRKAVTRDYSYGARAR